MYEHLFCDFKFCDRLQVFARPMYAVIIKIKLAIKYKKALIMRYKYSLSLSILQYCNRNMTEIIFKISLLYYNRHVRRILLQYRLCQKE